MWVLPEDMISSANSDTEKQVISILKVLGYGMVLLVGLNSVAAAVEAGIEVKNVAESGMMDFQQLVGF
jgi:repressor of nif and glnA expression